MTTSTKLMLKDRNVIDELARSGYLANEDQIEALARYNLQNVMGSDAVRGVYLKSLIVGIQAEIEKSQIESEPAVVLSKVHERYYKAVMRAVTPRDLLDDPNVPKEERKARSQERNRRGNFARSAKSTILAFIKADGDIMQLNAATITKTEMTAFSLAMRSAVADKATLKDRTLAAMAKLEELARELADSDKSAAAWICDQSLSRMADLLVELGVEITARSDVAVRDHKLLELPAGKFWPVLQPSAAN